MSQTGEKAEKTIIKSEKTTEALRDKSLIKRRKFDILPRKVFVVGQLEYHVGNMYEIKENDGLWYKAKILSINDSGKQVKVHFYRWNESFDRDCLVENLRPLSSLNKSYKGKL